MSRAVVLRSLAPGVARLLAQGLVMVALAGCSAGSLGGGGDAVGPSGAAADQRVSLETQAACRERVNEMYAIRDRADIYAANPSVNTPFSANYQPDVPSRGLSKQFGYEQDRADCEHNAATGGGDASAPAPAAKIQ
jgi:hypothetical protein